MSEVLNYVKNAIGIQDEDNLTDEELAAKHNCKKDEVYDKKLKKCVPKSPTPSPTPQPPTPTPSPGGTSQPTDTSITLPDGRVVEFKGILSVSAGPVPTPTPTPVPIPPGPVPTPTPSPTGNIGQDGVLQIYPTKQGGIEFYLGKNPDKNRFNISFGTGSHLPYTQKTEGGLTFFTADSVKLNYGSGGSGKTTRIDLYPDGGIWSNSTKFDWQNNPGYLYKDTIGADEEFTTYIRTHGSIGAHEAYAHKMAGRDEDAIRSVFEMVFPTASHSTVTANYNYAHFPYVSAKPNIIYNPQKLVDEKWLGMKTIRIVAADKKSSHWECWVSENPFDASGKPTNDWKKSATYEDHGTSGYKNIPATWACQKAVCRIDGHTTVDFALISWRNIDASKPNFLAMEEIQEGVNPDDEIPLNESSQESEDISAEIHARRQAERAARNQ